MNESVIASADFKVDKNGRKYPAKRIHMGEKEKQQVTEASYKGNIGVMELAKFHGSASAADKEHFTQLMKKKSEAKSDKEQQQMASQIWDHIQKTTGTKLHQMESVNQDYKKADTMTEMLSFATMLESKDDFILQTLADRDINASIKDGKVVVHDHTQHTKAKSMVKRMGMPHEVVKGMKEDVEQIDEEIPTDTTNVTIRGRTYKATPMHKWTTKHWQAAERESGVGMKGLPHRTKETLAKEKHMHWHISDYHVHDNRVEKDYFLSHHNIQRYKSTNEDTATIVQEAMPTHEFNKLVRGYLTHKKAAKVGGFKPMTMDQYKRTSVKALSVKEETIEELSKESLDSYSKKAIGKEKAGREWQRMSGLIRANMKKKEKVDEDQKVVVPVMKPRNPNQGILANKKNAAGMHVDKKKKMKMGNDKHKARVFEETNDE